MALFNKLFQSSKRKNGLHGESTKHHQLSNESIFPFSGEQVRILLFRKCDWNGSRLLFDSSAVQKVNIPSSNQLTTSNGQAGSTPEANPPRTFIEICNGYGYIYDQSSIESSSIGEMVFGSVAMSFKGPSLKVHWLREPKGILCSQVFLSPVCPKKSFCRGTSSNDVKKNENINDEYTTSQSNGNSTNSFSLSFSLCTTDKLTDLDRKTIPLDVPASIDRTNDAYSDCDSGHNSGADIWTTSSSYGYQSDRSSVVSMFSTDPSIVSSRKLSVDSAIVVDAAMNGRSSDGCLQRRILRNMSTSFENNLSGNDIIGYFDESNSNNNRSTVSVPSSMVRRHSDQCESKSNPEMVRRRKTGAKECLKPPNIHFSSYTPRSKSSQQRSKIGLAVCIRYSDSAEEEMQLFCSEHIALLESMLCRLRAAAESAYMNQKKFHQLMLHAWFATTSWITDLFTAPRIKEPVWFSLSNGFTDRPNNLAKHFMTELCWLLNIADTKDTNFFMSTLLTAILTNHLGWVATVAPLINSSVVDDQVITIHQNQAKMSEISKFHPYNVLWAQLGDLYGSIGNPTRLAKTIVCGTQTVTINKVLSVLTYFVRCGEIQRVNSTKELDKNEIEQVISNKSQQRNVSISNENDTLNSVVGNQSEAKGLSRSRTCLREIATVCYEDPIIPVPNNVCNYKFQPKALNVIHSPDASEFYQMIDTDVTPPEKINRNLTNNTIKLMVTSPNNDRFEYETASEAIEFILKKIEVTTHDAPPLTNQIVNAMHNHRSIETNSDEINENKPRRLLWGIDKIKEGISIDEWKAIAADEIDNAQLKSIELKRSQSLKTKPSITHSLRRSKTFREIKTNGIRNDINRMENDRFIVPSSTFEHSERIDAVPFSIQSTSLGQELRASNSEQRLEPTGNVVFVLGDNEVLSGLKTPPPSPILNNTKNENCTIDSRLSVSDQHCESSSTASSSHTNQNEFHSTNATGTRMPTPKSNVVQQEKKKKHCTHKKHSGVKFNFEQYPQIVTNYMKNKNLDITSYDFLEKGLKLDQVNTFNFGASSTSFIPPMADDIQEHDDQDDEEQCECCANTFRILQTPSNATELELDDPVPITKPISKQLSTLIENDTVSNGSYSGANPLQIEEDNGMRSNQPCENENENDENESRCKKESIGSIKRMNHAKNFELITLPIPRTKIVDDNRNHHRIRPGYVPSLFVGITDHFIPDMVLQGITTPPQKWEPFLKQNLTLTSHCATFEQIPAENVAIIANIDKWDVRLVSSQSYTLSSNMPSGPIGMSQLVSTMLETVHAMWLAGTSAYQCMSFLESKLKEIYLQSETLAAFLLTTEFCSLNTVTTALNLSANDVPLLLSIASIHSPQVTKKYGISFR